MSDDLETKIDIQKSNWFKTEKGKEAKTKYRTSDKGKEAQKRYDDSPKAKLARRKYYYGDKGQEAHARRATKVKSFKELEQWLKENPGKTPQDFLALEEQE